MLKLFLATAVAALVTSGAGASSFSACRGIADDTARLDCYDRIATTGQPSPIALATNSDQFSGFYAGVSGHFGGADKNLYERDWHYGDHSFRLNASSIGAFAGYNQSIGNIVLGVEAAIRGDTSGREAYRYDSEYTASFPQFSFLQYGGINPWPGSGTRYENRGPLLMASSYSATTSIREQVAPMISARAGYGFGNAIFYGRGGIGASYMSSKTTMTASITSCTDTIMQIDYAPSWQQGTYIECLDPETTSDSSSVEHTRLAPTFAAAIGAEYHHDRYFGRIEAEARYIHWGNTFLPSGDSGTMRYQVGFGAGIKF